MAQAIQCNHLRLRDLTEGLYAVKIFFLVLILGKSVLVKVMAIDFIRTLVLRLILLLLTSSSESGGRKVHWNYPSFSHKGASEAYYVSASSHKSPASAGAGVFLSWLET